MSLISYDDFKKVDILVGTIISATENNSLKKPSIVLEIDFGKKIGIKKSSAQLKANYSIDKLVNKQVAAVINFPPKQIGKMISEVLVLGFPDNNNEPILISPDIIVSNGGRLLPYLDKKYVKYNSLTILLFLNPVHITQTQYYQNVDSTRENVYLLLFFMC